jgi:hypothetical protein
MHSAIYDPVRDRMVAFGGHGWRLTCFPSPTDCNDCYDEPSFSGQGCRALTLSPELAWTTIDIGGEPDDRAEHSAIYDPVRDRMVVYGGSYRDGCCAWAHPSADFSDATALTFGAQRTWQPVAVGAPPRFTYGSQAVYEPSLNRMLVYGGYELTYSGGVVIGDRVSYDLTTETPTGELPGQGPPRTGFSIVIDPVRDRLVLFGGTPHVGVPGGLVNDTWVADLGAGTPWQELITNGVPPAPRWDHTAVYDPVTDQMLVYGGIVILGPSPEPDRSLWSLQFGPAPEWAEKLYESPFVAHGYPTVVLDSDCRRLVFFGDQGADDVWVLPLDPVGAWARLSPSGPGPDPGGIIEAIFDSHRHRVVVNRQWALSLGSAPAWTRLCIKRTGPPTIPWELPGAAVYDPVGDRLVVCTDGAGSFWALRFRPQEPTAVGRPRAVAAGLHLSQPSPNPTHGPSRFVLELAEPADVSLSVFDTQGRRVAMLASGRFGAGGHALSWDGSAAGGGPVAAGLYFLRATSATATSFRRLLIMP